MDEAPGQRTVVSDRPLIAINIQAFLTNRCKLIPDP
jgi:hypothetical protein